MRVVAGIIEDGEGRILIAQRPPGKRLAGLWEFPGGKVEEGETPEVALVRELQEELELDVEIRESMGEFPYVYDWGAIELNVFVVSARGVPKATADIHVFKWATPSSIQERELAPADISPLQKYRTSRPKP